MFHRGQKVKYDWVCSKCKQEQTTYDGAYDKIRHQCCGSVFNLELDKTKMNLHAEEHNEPILIKTI